MSGEINKIAIYDERGNSVYVNDCGDVTIKLRHLTGVRDLGRIVDNVFHMKPKKKSKHLFRKANAWGINDKLLRFLVDMGIDKIVFLEKEDNVVFSATPDTWHKHGTRLSFGKEGYELQCFLKSELFTVTNFMKGATDAHLNTD